MSSLKRSTRGRKSAERRGSTTPSRAASSPRRSNTPSKTMGRAGTPRKSKVSSDNNVSSQCTPPRAGTIVRSTPKLLADFPAKPTGWPYKDPYDFMNGKRVDDNVPPHCHRVHNRIYDLKSFDHPGGELWLDLTRGTDITELFESHHIDYKKATAVLTKYVVAEHKSPRNSPCSFDKDGFYFTLREKVWHQHRSVAALGPPLLSKVFADCMVLVSVYLTCLVGSFAASDGWSAGARMVVLVGIFNGLFIGIGHNFMHQKTNFRRFYLDISGFSSAEFRMHHALSHHPFTNTTLDAEMNSLLPNINFFPAKKSMQDRLVAGLTLVVACTVAIPLKQCQRVVKIALGTWPGDFEDKVAQVIPLFQLILLANFTLMSESLGRAVGLLLLMQAATSSFFLWLNFISGPHFNDECWHQGDTLDSTDWGILQVQTSVERSELPSAENITPINLFNTLTFGLHQLHHLFPTIDAVHLTTLVPLFEEHCREHGVLFITMSNAALAAGLWRCIISAYEVPNLRTRNGIHCVPRSKAIMKGSKY